MVNVLIADDNVHYATSLMNMLNKSNNNIKVCYIAKDGKETIETINNCNDIDVIILDLKMPIYNGNEILNMIEDKNKYKDSCIIVSGEIDLIKEIPKNGIVHSIIPKMTDTNEIIKNINELMNYKEKMLESQNLKNRITSELLYLGFNISHKGTKYLISAIEYIALRPNKEILKLEKDIYPAVSFQYKETIHNVKCNINRATTTMYCECEIEKLKKYFSFSKDAKPNIKTIIETIANKVI